jgi:phosphatidate cytidylyltransferase
VTTKNRNLVARIASAAVLLPLVIVMLREGGYWTAALLAIGSAACAAEYYQITMKRWLTPAGLVGVAAALLLPIFPVWQPLRAGELSFWLVANLFILSWAYHLLHGDLQEGPMLSGHLVMGMLYGGVGMGSLSALRHMGEHGLGWVLCACTITWANDTCAYFAGRFLGKHKIYPAVSPNKTWEGFFGGMAGSVIGMFCVRFIVFPELLIVDCVVVGILGGIVGPIGDLCESMLKRAYNVKDSGNTIPGHGGFLDRVDALLFNAPMLFVYVHFVRAFYAKG